MNKVILIGRLTRDPELKYSSSNIPVANFTVAVNRPFENQNGVREADFINIVVWRKQAENVGKYVKKGSLVAVEGRIQTRSYENNEGKKTYVTEVIASNVEFLQTKKNDTSKSNEENTTEANDPYAEFGNQITLEDLDNKSIITDDDLPF